MSAAKPAPDRRAVLGGSLAMASAVAASAAPIAAEAAADPDDVLIDLGRQWMATVREAGEFEREVGQGNISHEDALRCDARYDREQAILDAIFNLPATTAQGLAVKGRVVLRSIEIDWGRDIPLIAGDVGFLALAQQKISTGDRDEQHLGSLIADILRLAEAA